MGHRKLCVGLMLLITGCRYSEEKADNVPPNTFAAPKSIRLQTKNKYTVNAVTGDSISPVKNEKGKLIQTGIAVPANMTISDTGFLHPPVTIPAEWTLADTLRTNISVIRGRPDTILLNEKALLQFPGRMDTSTYVQLDINKDTVVTGVLVPAESEVVPCIRPVLKKMLPMSISANTRYCMKQLNTYHGLSSSTIFHVMEDNRGNLWFSTIDGLICYDGQYSQTYRKKQGLLADMVFYTFQDSRGNIWIDYGRLGLTCYDGKNFIHYKSKKAAVGGLGGNAGFAEDSKGNIWFKSLVDGITRFDGKNFTHYTRKQGLLSNHVRGMLVDSKDRLWLGSRKGITVLDGKSVLHLTKNNGLNNDVVSCFTEDRQGNIWIGTDSGLAVYNGKNLVRITKVNGLCGNLVGDVKQDKEGNIWISTYENGASRFDGNTFTSFGTSEGLADIFLHNVLPGRKGGCWFVSGKGVSYFNDTYLTRMVDLPGYSERGPNNILIQKGGEIISGDRMDGLYKTQGNMLYNLTDRDSISKGSISPLLMDQKGGLWYSIRRSDKPFNSGLACFDGTSIRFYRTRTGQINDFVRSVMENRQGKFWAATSKGIVLLDENRMQWITESNGLSSNQVFRVLETRDGTRWIGSFAGLTKYDGKTFTHFTEFEGLPGRKVYGMAEDNEGGLWVSTDNGIVFIRGQETLVFTEEHGLPGRKTYQIAGMDANKNIWFSSGSEIGRIPANYAEQLKITVQCNCLGCALLKGMVCHYLFPF